MSIIRDRFRFQQTGFTLIELLVALAIFAILAAITSLILYYALSTRTKVAAQATRLATLQLTIIVITRNMEQTVNRAVRNNDGYLLPAFIGQSDYLEFTHDGLANPNSEEKRSTLKRIALLCRNNQLLERSWNSLDPINRGDYEEKILLDKLKACHFAYLNNKLQLLNQWSDLANQKFEPLPKAVQLSLNLTDIGELSFLFLIPKAVYANTE